mmetsp:Transcript_9911/g.13856  ORF Transcript_9911/g.13856 Transcript_9911/m.13856 type:complete len:82 (-) Transcript_9911:1463-1708(-)
MVIQHAGQKNTQQNPRSHDNCEDNRTKVFDSIEDEDLPNCRADGKQKEVQMNLRVSVHKTQCWAKFIRVDERNERKHCRKG